MRKKTQLKLDLSLNGKMQKMIRKFKFESLSANPKSKPMGFASSLSSVFEISARDHAETQFFGEIMTAKIQDCTTDELKELFDDILKMKANREFLHRNSYAYLAYCQFISETSREPSKWELKKYILARSDRYREAPSKGDGKGWTRVWEEAGLTKLKSK